MAHQYDTDSSCDEATSSLGDSSYDFVDDRSTMTDDEEGDHMTESTSSDSIEADRPVVVTSQQHTLPAMRDDANNETHSDPTSFDLKTPTYSAHHEYGAFDSTRASEETESSREHPDGIIQFKEPSVVNLNISRSSEVSYTLKVIEDPHQTEGKFRDAIQDMPQGKIHLDVRQTMASRGIDLKDKPYKILVAGDVSMKEPIIRKLGATLAANAGSFRSFSRDAQPSKFSIVPVSAFGDYGHPDVVLINSSGLEMIVDDCTTAGYSHCHDGKDTLSLRMADDSHVQSWWISSRYELSNDWKLPDLAIFCVSEEESHKSRETRGLARSFMDRHAVPSIVIQKHAMWDRNTENATLKTFNRLTPHLCLESQHSNCYNPLSKRRYPIDLGTFLSIDAGQLNRNLACYAAPKRVSEPPAETFLNQKISDCRFWYSNASKAIREYSKHIFQERVTPVLPLLPFLLCLMGPLIIWGLRGFPVTFKGSDLTVITQTTPTSTSSPVVVTTSNLSLTKTLASVASSAAPVSSSPPSHRPLSSNTAITSLLLDAYDLRQLGPDKSDDFIVQVLGDCHIIINTPRWFRQSKNLPTPQFNVSRHDEIVEHSLSTIGHGVYALQIPYEDAYGALDLSTTIGSRSTEQRKFEVDFGSSWLRVAAWKRATRALVGAMQNDLSIAQTGLTVAYNHSLTELSTIVRQAKFTMAAQRKSEHAVLASHLKWGAQTKDLVIAQTKDLSKNVSVRLQLRRKQAVQHVRSLTKAYNRSIAACTRDGMRLISPHAKQLAQSIMHLKAQAPNHAAERLKSAQKAALRVWWKITGVPKTSRLLKKERPIVCEDVL